MDHDVVRLMLRSFTVLDPHLVNNIRENPRYTKMTPEEILGKFVSGRMMIKEARYVDDALNGPIHEPQTVALKATRSKEVLPRKVAQVEAAGLNEEEMALIIKRFKTSLRGRKEHPNKTKTKGKRSCFKCGKIGHFIANCPDNDSDQEQDVRKTPSLSSLSRNDTTFERVAVPPCRFTVLVFAAHTFSGCEQLFIWCKNPDDSPSYLQHYINGRVGVKLPQHSLLLHCFAAKIFNHSRSLTFAFKRSSNLVFASLEEELQKRRLLFSKKFFKKFKIKWPECALLLELSARETKPKVRKLFLSLRR
jgi:hypothetical protein